MTAPRWTAHSLITATLMIAACLGVWAQPTALVTPPPFPAPPVAPLTVEDAVKFALRYNPSITIGVENVQIAQDQVNSARANGLPTASIAASANYFPTVTPVVFQGTTVSGFQLPSSAQVTVNQPVWPPSRWKAPVDSAKANVCINAENLERTRQQVAFQTREAFFQLQTAQDLLAVSQYSVTVAETQLKLANATFTAGTEPKLDVRQAEATLESARVNYERAQNNLDQAQATLAVQIGLPAGSTVAIVPPDSLPIAPTEVDPLITRAFVSRPELRELTFRKQQILANIALIHLEQQLLVNVSGSYNQAISGGSVFGTEGLGFGLSASLTLYNGGKMKADLAAANKQLEQVNTTAEQLKLGITLDVRSAWLALESALKQLTAADKQWIAAEEALRIAELRYKEGEGIQLEVDQARLNSTQALTSLSLARLQAQVAAAQLEFAIGAPVTAQLPTTPAPPLPVVAPTVPAPAVP